uniref:Uncharacterized protein n=1 Tax=Caenorhabditis japonica TaxID=281687 RepID=A0A8R1IN64_CAEJA
MIRSPTTPRTRAAFKKRPCTCKLVTVRDDCRQDKKKNKWISSDEEETDTDKNLIPTTMKQKQQMILNR